MYNKAVIIILLAAVSLTVSAQTEGNGKITLSGNDAALKEMDLNNQILTDTMRFNVEALQPELQPMTVKKQNKHRNETTKICFDSAHIIHTCLMWWQR